MCAVRPVKEPGPNHGDPTVGEEAGENPGVRRKEQSVQKEARRARDPAQRSRT